MSQTTKMIGRMLRDKVRKPFFVVADISGIIVVISFIWRESTIFEVMWLSALLAASIVRTISTVDINIWDVDDSGGRIVKTGTKPGRR